MASQHTKGPWSIDPRASTHVIAGGRGICSTGGYGRYGRTEVDADTENEANAHLIALAPEMYDALKAGLTFLSNRKVYEAVRELLDHIDGE